MEAICLCISEQLVQHVYKILILHGDGINKMHNLTGSYTTNEYFLLKQKTNIQNSILVQMQMLLQHNNDL